MMSVLLTFSVALVIEGMLGFVFSGTQRRIQLPYSGDSLELFGASIAVVKLIAFGLAAVSLGALFLILKKTQFGQALRATIQHPEAARLIGINTDRIAGYGFGLGLATAAIGGTALALDSTIYPSLHWHWIGPLMAIIVVGGLGSIPGAAIAAMLLGARPEPAADPARDHVGADHLLRRAVRHLDGAPAGILRRSSCPALLSTNRPDVETPTPVAPRRLAVKVGLLVLAAVVLAFPAWPPTRSSCRSAS